jgi:hypothetical protein
VGTHIIRRQILDVEIDGSESDGLALQRRLPELSRDWLTPALDEVLDRLIPAHEHWLVDRLYVDAGAFRPESLERGLIEAVTRAVEQYLRERGAPQSSIASAAASRAGGRTEPASFWPTNPSDGIERRTAAMSIQEALCHFLQTGVLPWWIQLRANETLEEVILAIWRAPNQPDALPKQFARAVLDVVRQATARKRLVRQFSRTFLATLLAGVSYESASTVQEVLTELEKKNIPSRVVEDLAEYVWASAFDLASGEGRLRAEILIAESLHAMSLGGPPLDSHLIEQITQLWPAARVRERGAGEDADPTPEATMTSRMRGKDAGRSIPSSPDLEEGVHIGCAGVVLLHPFLPRLFAALGIANEKQLLQPERALALLHFLATGQRSAPEYELPLPKILCNVPLEEPVTSRIELTSAEEEEAVALLSAVIRHWSALGDTSVDGLRGSFLVRPGKLSRRGSDDLLQVEARSYDLLLDRLPWGIGLIQLPWMKSILWVEWRL